MMRFRFLKLIGTIVLLFVFIRIYQHNHIVRLQYTCQRLERQKFHLTKMQDRLLSVHLRMQNCQCVKNWAHKSLGMQELRLSQTVTLTMHALDHESSG